jgi:CheY-like chemotaxis protein
MRILVVDRDSTVADACEKAFQNEHEVVTARSGFHALELIAIGRAFDLVLCELSLPDITGPEVHRRLMGSSPRTASKIVFITDDAKASHTFLQTVPNIFLEKPLAATALRQVLRDVTLK